MKITSHIDLPCNEALTEFDKRRIKALAMGPAKLEKWWRPLSTMRYA